MVEKMFLIIVGAILTFGGPVMMWQGIKWEIKKELPPGYSFLCGQNNKYKWTGGGFMMGGEGYSKQEVINHAWRDYKNSPFLPCDND